MPRRGQLKMNKNEVTNIYDSLARTRLFNVPEIDLQTLVTEAASLILKGEVTPEQLKEQLPSLYQVLILEHVDYQAILHLYTASTKKKNYISENDLADDVKDEVVQAGILKLANSLAQGLREYIQSTNKLQQTAVEMVCQNIRRVRKAGKAIFSNVANERLKRYLESYTAYLAVLATTEKQIYQSLGKVNKVKDGSEAYKHTCAILTKALQGSLKNHEVQSEEVAFDKDKKNFIEKLREKLTITRITQRVVLEFIPEIYAAIGPGLSEEQMQAMVDMAAHLFRVNALYVESDKLYQALKDSHLYRALSIGGVKHQAPRAFFEEVVYAPMEVASQFVSQQMVAAVPFLETAKKLLKKTYVAGNLISAPMAFVNGLMKGHSSLRVESLIKMQCGEASTLTESMYVAGWMFYDFCCKLGEFSQEDAEENLFNHYFQVNAKESLLSFEAYETHKPFFVELAQLFNKDRQIVLPAVDENTDFSSLSNTMLAVIIRMNEIESLFSQSVSQEKISQVIDELEILRVYFKARVENKGEQFSGFYVCFGERLQVIVRLIQERLWIPIIFDLIDTGVVKKEDQAYAFLGEMLKLIQRKLLISPADLSQLIALLPDDANLASLKEMIKKMGVWSVGTPVAKVLPPSSPLMQSIRTDVRQYQGYLESTLNLFQPKLIIESVILYLDKQIEKSEQMSVLFPGHSIFPAKNQYAVAVKGILQAIIKSQVLDDHKWLAKKLYSLSVSVSIPDIRKRDLAKFLVRVADTFGPVAGSASESSLWVDKLMQFILDEIDGATFASSYRDYSDAHLNYTNQLKEVSVKNFSDTWFKDELMDPLDMGKQGGQIAHLIIGNYVKFLMAHIHSESGLGGILGYLRAVPGYAYLAEVVSSRFSDDSTGDVITAYVCQYLGVAPTQDLTVMSYSEQLTHVYFKWRLAREKNHSVTLDAVALVLLGENQPKQKEDLASLATWAELFTWTLKEDPLSLFNSLLAIHGNKNDLFDQALQLFLMHCQNLHSFAEEHLENREKRNKIFKRINTALSQGLQEGHSNLFLQPQLDRIELALKSCHGRRELAKIREQEVYRENLNALSANVKEANDALSPEANKTSRLKRGLFAGYYLADAGYNAYGVYVLVQIVMASITAFKAVTSVTAAAIFQAVGAGLMVTPLGLALLGARFVFSLAWQIFQQRNEFRNIWRSDKSVVEKVLRTVGRSLFVLGCALVGTLVTNLVVDKLRVLDFRQVGVIGWLRDKWNAKPRRAELATLQEKLTSLKNKSMNDPDYSDDLQDLKECIEKMKYNPTLKAGFKEKVNKLVQALPGVIAPLDTSNALIQARLSDSASAHPEPEKKAAATSSITWEQFASSRKRGDIIRFSRDAKGPSWSIAETAVGFFHLVPEEGVASVAFSVEANSLPAFGSDQ